MGRKGIPKGWLNYTPVGTEIEGVHIVACKVPLKEYWVRNRLGQDKWFTAENLIEMIPNVGCVIDLTATNRYYDSKILTEKGIEHFKIFCKGHGEIPHRAAVNKFFELTDKFLRSVRSEGKVLVVHCTHGVNRTGYLVCRFLIERRGYSPAAAITAFNQARGHVMERDSYLTALRRMGNKQQNRGSRPSEHLRRRQEQTSAPVDEGGRAGPSRSDDV